MYTYVHDRMRKTQNVSHLKAVISLQETWQHLFLGRMLLPGTLGVYDLDETEGVAYSNDQEQHCQGRHLGESR